MPGLKSAAIGVWVGAGGRHERPEQNGIAHFLEHMAFKGTKTRSAVQIAEAIEDVGGYINAYTSREATAYYVRLSEDDVPLGLEVVSDILLNPIFDARDRIRACSDGVVAAAVSRSAPALPRPRSACRCRRRRTRSRTRSSSRGS